MVRRDLRHSTASDGRRLRRWSAGLVAVVLALAVASDTFDLGARVLGWEQPSPLTAPAEVKPPPGLSLPSPVAAPVVAPAPAADGEVALDPTAVRRALARMLRDRDLGPRVAVAVATPGDEPVFTSGPATVTPASTMKLLTTTAALAALGPEHVFGTSAVPGRSGREVVLVGGGDPLLAREPAPDAYPARADVTTLAKATARALKNLGRIRVRVGYDTSLFTGPAVSPAWRASYIPDGVVSPIEALWVDEGRPESGFGRDDDPALEAALMFARALERQGIEVRGRPRPTLAPDDSVEYATVRSAPLAQIVRWVLEVSDNEAAEVLLRHVAQAERRPASFAGGAGAVRDVLTGLGVDLTGARIFDGSGLSRRNLLSASTLLDVLSVAAAPDHPELRPVVTGLPVAGFTGSLTYRFDTGARRGLGLVRAKTGTLTGVHGLAGLVTDRTGAVLSFAAVADRVKVPDTLDARERLDQVAAALAACRCTG